MEAHPGKVFCIGALELRFLVDETQGSGDLVMFDDVQIEGVAKAVKELRAYAIEYVDVLPNRRYAIGVRK